MKKERKTHTCTIVRLALVGGIERGEGHRPATPLHEWPTENCPARLAGACFLGLYLPFGNLNGLDRDHNARPCRLSLYIQPISCHQNPKPNELAIAAEGLQNHSPLHSCTGRGQIMVLESISMWPLIQDLHDGSSSIQIRWRCIPIISAAGFFDLSQLSSSIVMAAA